MTLALAPTPTLAESGTLGLLARVQVLNDELEQPDLDVGEVISVSRRAEVLQAAARAAHAGLEAANAIAEVKLRAERRAGMLLRQMVTDPGPWKRHPRSKQLRQREHLPDGTLSAIGITSKQSSDWQLISRLGDVEFEARIAALKAEHRQIYSKLFLRAARQYLKPIARRPTTPVADALSKAVQLLRTVRMIDTAAEVRLAREVVSIAQSWSVGKPPAPLPRPTAIVREISCLMCGRPQPPNRPPKCPHCRGAWMVQ